MDEMLGIDIQIDPVTGLIKRKKKKVQRPRRDSDEEDMKYSRDDHDYQKRRLKKLFEKGTTSEDSSTSFKNKNKKKDDQSPDTSMRMRGPSRSANQDVQDLERYRKQKEYEERQKKRKEREEQEELEYQERVKLREEDMRKKAAKNLNRRLKKKKRKAAKKSSPDSEPENLQYKAGSDIESTHLKPNTHEDTITSLGGKKSDIDIDDASLTKPEHTKYSQLKEPNSTDISQTRKLSRNFEIIEEDGI